MMRDHVNVQHTLYCLEIFIEAWRHDVGYILILLTSTAISDRLWWDSERKVVVAEVRSGWFLVLMVSFRLFVDPFL